MLFLFLFLNKNRLPIRSSRLRHWLARLLKSAHLRDEVLSLYFARLCAKCIIHNPRTRANAEGVRKAPDHRPGIAGAIETSENSVQEKFTREAHSPGPNGPGRAGGDGYFAGAAMRPTRWGKPWVVLGEWAGGARQKGRSP